MNKVNINEYEFSLHTTCNELPTNPIERGGTLRSPQPFLQLAQNCKLVARRQLDQHFARARGQEMRASSNYTAIRPLISQAILDVIRVRLMISLTMGMVITRWRPGLHYAGCRVMYVGPLLIVPATVRAAVNLHIHVKDTVAVFSENRSLRRIECDDC